MYTRKINSPKAKASAMAITISSAENEETFSKKLDLNRSLKVVIANFSFYK